MSRNEDEPVDSKHPANKEYADMSLYKDPLERLNFTTTYYINDLDLVTYDTTTREVASVSSIEGIKAEVPSPRHVLLGSQEEQINGHIPLVFKGDGLLATNIKTDLEGKADIETVTIVYKNNIGPDHEKAGVIYGGLFGDYADKWTRFAHLTKNQNNASIVIGGSVDKAVVIGSATRLSIAPSASTIEDANPIVADKVICLTVQWDYVGGTNASSVFCNGLKLVSFTASEATLNRDNFMLVGSIGRSVESEFYFNGNVYYFSHRKGVAMTDIEIKGVHNVLTNEFNIKTSDSVTSVLDKYTLKMDHLSGKAIGDIEMGKYNISSNAPMIDRHLANKKYIDDKISLGSPALAGNATGDINMGVYKVISDTPTDDTHLANKKYIDDKLHTGPIGLGGMANRDIDMGARSISSNSPTLDRHLANKKYVDDRLTSNSIGLAGKASGDIDMKNYLISMNAPVTNSHLANKEYVDTILYKDHLANLSFTTSYYINDLETVTYDESTRRVSRITSIEGIEANAPINGQPLIGNHVDKVNGHLPLVFSHDQELITGIKTDLEGQPDTEIVTIVYKNNVGIGHSKFALTYGGLFGDLTTEWSRYVYFTSNNDQKSLVVSGATDKALVIGKVSRLDINPSTDVLPGADPTLANEMICLTVQWNHVGGTNASSVFCNGVKLANFTSVEGTINRNPNVIIGSVGEAVNDNLRFDGNIYYFSHKKGTAMTDKEIKHVHSVLINEFNVNAPNNVIGVLDKYSLKTDGLSGTASGNIDMKEFTISAGAPTDTRHLTNKEYVDSRLTSSSGGPGGLAGTAIGHIDMDSYTISAGAPTDDRHLANKKYIDDRVNNSETGLAGVATGDIDMSTYSVSADAPSNDKHLANKKYIDDKITSTVDLVNVVVANTASNYLLKTDNIKGAATGDVDMLEFTISAGAPTDTRHLTNKEYVDSKVASSGTGTGTSLSGDATGNIDMQEFTISAGAPTDTRHLTNKEYVDSKVASSTATGTGASLSGDATGNIDMQMYRITGDSPIHSKQLANKEYIDNSIYRQPMDTLNFTTSYYINDLGLVTYNETTRKVTNVNSIEGIEAKPPKDGEPLIGTNDDTVNGYFPLVFAHIHELKTGIKTDLEGQLDIETVTIIYKNNVGIGHSKYQDTYCGLFGDLTTGWTRYVYFASEGNEDSLVVSGAIDKAVVIGRASTKSINPVMDVIADADPTLPNKMICLTVQWDYVGGTNASSIFCNGKKLASFTASPGTANRNPNVLLGAVGEAVNDKYRFDGSIYYFSHRKGIAMTDNEIKRTQTILCREFNVETPVKMPRVLDKYLLKTDGLSGNASGNIDMQSHLISMNAPVTNRHLANKEYVDMSLYTDQLAKLSFSTSYYITDLDTITYDESTKLITSITSIEGTEATSADNRKPMIGEEADKINGHFPIKFAHEHHLITGIKTDLEGQPDTEIVTIVYKNNVGMDHPQYDSVYGGLFGEFAGASSRHAHLAATGDKKSLVVSGLDSNLMTIGKSPRLGINPVADVLPGADPTESDKIICLTIQWNAVGGTNASSVFCNGMKLVNFTASPASGMTRATNILIGSISDDISDKYRLNGNVYYFSHKKGTAMTDDEIKYSHGVLCNEFNVQTPMNIGVLSRYMTKGSDINMDTHSISSSFVPVDDTNLINKKYMDDKLGDYLKKTSHLKGAANGNIEMKDYRIYSDWPISNRQLTNRDYVDKLLFGEQLHRLGFSTSYYIRDKDMDLVTYDESSKLVSSLNSIEGREATSADDKRPKIGEEADKVNGYTPIKFAHEHHLITGIRTNLYGPDTETITIVYKNNVGPGHSEFGASYGGLFGEFFGGPSRHAHLCGMGSTSTSLVIDGTTAGFVPIGKAWRLGVKPIGDVQPKADPTEVDKLICLTIQWDAAGGANASSVFCNGVKLVNFTARAASGMRRTPNYTIGSISLFAGSELRLDGNIYYFSHRKATAMTDYEIKCVHNILCPEFGIETQDFFEPGGILGRYSIKGKDLAGPASGDVSMGVHSITATHPPVLNTELANRGYVKYSIIKTIHTLLPDLLKDIKIQDLNCLYDVTNGTNGVDIDFESGREISKIYDKTTNNVLALQSNNNLRPLLSTDAERKHGKHYMKFSGSKYIISNLDLNPETPEKDIVNIFIVYERTKSGPYVVELGNALFGHDNKQYDNYDKTVCFTSKGDIVVGASSTNFSSVGPSALVKGVVPVAKHKKGADPSKLNEIICLSVHWNTPAGTDGSSIYCNGQHIGSFTASSSPGDTKLSIGSLRITGSIPFAGNIYYFSCKKAEVIPETRIFLQHALLCSEYNIQTI